MLQGHFFYRIIDQFIDQSGAETESVFGGRHWHAANALAGARCVTCMDDACLTELLLGAGQFDDDLGGLALKHDRRGLLSMANMGPNTNTSHFSIMAAPAPHLNAKYTIFGEVVAGIDVVMAVNKLAAGKPDNHAGAEAGAQIVDAGQLP